MSNRNWNWVRKSNPSRLVDDYACKKSKIPNPTLRERDGSHKRSRNYSRVLRERTLLESIEYWNDSSRWIFISENPEPREREHFSNSYVLFLLLLLQEFSYMEEDRRQLLRRLHPTRHHDEDGRGADNRLAHDTISSHTCQDRSESSDHRNWISLLNFFLI